MVKLSILLACIYFFVCYSDTTPFTHHVQYLLLHSVLQTPLFILSSQFLQKYPTKETTCDYNLEMRIMLFTFFSFSRDSSAQLSSICITAFLGPVYIYLPLLANSSGVFLYLQNPFLKHGWCTGCTPRLQSLAYYWKSVNCCNCLL